MIKIKEIREAQAFNDYRNYLIGKYNKTYFNTVDLILNVTQGDYGIEYTVKDLKSNIIRRHNTKILRKEVFQW